MDKPILLIEELAHLTRADAEELLLLGYVACIAVDELLSIVSSVVA